MTFAHNIQAQIQSYSSLSFYIHLLIAYAFTSVTVTTNQDFHSVIQLCRNGQLSKRSVRVWKATDISQSFLTTVTSMSKHRRVKGLTPLPPDSVDQIQPTPDSIQVAIPIDIIYHLARFVDHSTTRACSQVIQSCMSKLLSLLLLDHTLSELIHAITSDFSKHAAWANTRWFPTLGHHFPHVNDVEIVNLRFDVSPSMLSALIFHNASRLSFFHCELPTYIQTYLAESYPRLVDFRILGGVSFNRGHVEEELIIPCNLGKLSNLEFLPDPHSSTQKFIEWASSSLLTCGVTSVKINVLHESAAKGLWTMLSSNMLSLEDLTVNLDVKVTAPWFNWVSRLQLTPNPEERMKVKLPLKALTIGQESTCMIYQLFVYALDLLQYLIMDALETLTFNIIINEDLSSRRMLAFERFDEYLSISQQIQRVSKVTFRCLNLLPENDRVDLWIQNAFPTFMTEGEVKVVVVEM
ncbi:hypothetical protein ABKN59_006515 [Abortiporus biennis]